MISSDFSVVSTLRRVAGQAVEVGEGDATFARRPLDPHGRPECGQGHAHVRRMGGDAPVAGAEDRMDAVHALDGRAARAGLALVAGRARVVEIIAAVRCSRLPPVVALFLQLGTRLRPESRDDEQRVPLLETRAMVRQRRCLSTRAHRDASHRLRARSSMSVIEQPVHDPPAPTAFRRCTSSGRRGWFRQPMKLERLQSDALARQNGPSPSSSSARTYSKLFIRPPSTCFAAL